MKLLEQAQKEGLERVKGIAVVVEDVTAVGVHVLYQVAVIWGEGQDLAKICAANP